MFSFNMFADNIFGEFPRRFVMEYTCFSVSMLPGNERDDVERGGKIIMPPSSLELLTRLNINYPMLFKLTNERMNRTTHSGVLEFVADEGRVYLPHWMMRNLLLDEGDHLKLESVSLPIATFSRFQPQTVDFLDITNPKAVLENCLRSFACLTTGDMIAISYNSRIYELCVLETQPGPAVTIIECDMNVDFAAPIGYTESTDVTAGSSGLHDGNPGEGTSAGANDNHDYYDDDTFVPFKGTGNRLDGKKRKDSERDEKSIRTAVHVRGVPDYNYQVGFLKFMRNFRVGNSGPTITSVDDFQPFKGTGFTLKPNK